MERAADPGDLVIVDYTLTPEGMEPRSETGYGFVIGSGGVLPEMEEAVIGLAAGGSRQTRVRFADDHRNEALRGKSAEASVKVTEVKEKVLPALDDDFAKSVGGNFETLDALRDEVRKGLQRRREPENRRALESAVLEAVLAGHAFEVPGRPGAAAGGAPDRARAGAACAGRGWIRTRCRGTTRSCSRSCGRARRRRSSARS